MLALLIILGVAVPMFVMALLFTDKIGTPQKERGGDYYEERAEKYWRDHHDNRT